MHRVREKRTDLNVRVLIFFVRLGQQRFKGRKLDPFFDAFFSRFGIDVDAYPDVEDRGSEENAHEYTRTVRRYWFP